MEIETLGYNSFFESHRKQFGLDKFPVARVTSETKGAYKVKNANGEYTAKITGKRMFQASGREDYPAVGDWVVLSDVLNNQATIQDILPRKTIIRRKYGDKNRVGEKKEMQIIATNIDVAFVVESLDRDYNLNRLERYFVIAKNDGATPVIILNKVDLIPKEILDEKITHIKNRIPEVVVLTTSTKNNKGLDDLKKFIEKGKTYCFLGSSGVGKSSLINSLLGESVIRTETISAYSGRGKHVTTNRQMYFLENGGIVIDNPGIREVGLTDMKGEIDSVFDEITSLSEGCKYVNCTHTQEPGCAVLAAVAAGKLDEERYFNYLTLRKEAEYYEMNDTEKREKDRQFGKFIKKAKKELKTFGNKNL
jgi:ribosome biogenesis GTPase